jgi:hypothetical protein
MKTERLLQKRLIIGQTCFVEIKIWRVPKAVLASRHDFKNSLALISNGICVLRYDNEAGKGDHRHIGTKEVSYSFSTLEMLQDDFWKNVEQWLKQDDRS